MAMALGVCGLAALVLVHVSDRNERTLAPSQRLSSLVLQLGAIQSGAFLAMEIIERVAAHVPVATLFTGHVLVLGLAFQVLTASLGALLLRWLHRAVAAVVGVLRASCRSPVATTTGGVPDAPFVLRAAMTGASGLRGPPFA